MTTPRFKSYRAVTTFAAAGMVALSLVRPAPADEVLDAIRDVVRTTVSWQWEPADIDDPGDADLLTVPETLPEDAVQFADVADELGEAHDPIDDPINLDRYYDVIWNSFPLASAKSLDDPEIQWVLELEKPVVTALEKQLQRGTWSLQTIESNYPGLHGPEYPGLHQLIQAINLNGRSLNVAQATNNQEQMLVHLIRSCAACAQFQNLGAKCLLSQLVSISLSLQCDIQICESLRFHSIDPDDRDTFVAIREAHTEIKPSQSDLAASIRGEHQFLHDLLYAWAQADDITRKLREALYLVSLDFTPVTDSRLGGMITRHFGSFFLQPNRTLKRSAMCRRREIDLARQPLHLLWNHTKHAISQPPVEPSLTIIALETLSGNGIGSLINRMGVSKTPPICFQRFIRSTATHNLTDLALALRLYQIDHDQALPESLDALVPDYLDALPVDPYSNQPYGFRIADKNFVLWSVGEDGKNRNGELSDDEIDEFRRSFISHTPPSPAVWPAMWVKTQDITLRLPIRPAPYPSGE